MRVCLPRSCRRIAAALVLGCFPLSSHAQGPDVLALIRAGTWSAADAAAADVPDPVARKLVLYYRLLSPHQAALAELTQFLDTSPDWPNRALLARRRDEALVDDPDAAAVQHACDENSPAIAAAAALLRCADLYAGIGRGDDATRLVRDAWVTSPADPAWETRFLARWGADLRPEDDRARFDRLAWSDPASAKRQVLRLTAGDRPVASARLALRTDAPTAAAQLAALTPAQRDDPGVFFEEARWLRRANRDAEAASLWAEDGAKAEATVPIARRAAFWDERNLLARRRLADGDAAGAFALVSAHAPYPQEQEADAQFMAGFIALRRLNDPAGAIARFQAVAAGSTAAITDARAHYWLARAETAAGDAAKAREEFQAATAHPATFYGQLAIAARDGPGDLGPRIRDQKDPPATNEQVIAFAGRELARAAAMLVAWGDARRAAAFLLRLCDVTPDPVDRALAGKLAIGFDLPDTAVWIGRRAGRDGITLIEAGWPAAASVPEGAGADPGLALGIIRQESSFDTATTSPAGALGLMQLMPGTARETARSLHVAAVIPALVSDPGYNMRLGTTYLGSLLAQYGGAVPLAVAAYNAGPGRVTQWLAQNGDPRTGAVDMIDWLELIPIPETRNYVQRVIENTVIYRARLGEPDPHPLAQWLR